MGNTLELEGFSIGSSRRVSSSTYPRFGRERQMHPLAAPVHADKGGTDGSEDCQVLLYARGIVCRMIRRAGGAGETLLPNQPQPQASAVVRLATTRVMSSSNPPLSGPRSHQLDR